MGHNIPIPPTTKRQMEAIPVDVGRPRCDFCGMPDPLWRYPCENFVKRVEGVTRDDQGVVRTKISDLRYLGAWRACTQCHLAYEEGGIDALATRVTRLYVEADPTLADPALNQRLRETMQDVFGDFEKHRDGPVQETTER